MLWFCQPVALVMSAIVAPSFRRMLSCQNRTRQRSQFIEGLLRESLFHRFDLFERKPIHSNLQGGRSLFHIQAGAQTRRLYVVSVIADAADRCFSNPLDRR